MFRHEVHFELYSKYSVIEGSEQISKTDLASIDESLKLPH